jgi:uncharacterized delta-60 repeat protein
MTRSFSTHQPTTLRQRRAFRPRAEGLEGRQLLSAGALDTTFNSTGYALPGPSGAVAVQIDSSGNILAAGTNGGTTSDFRVVRLTPSGHLDTTFGSSGSVTTDFAGQADRASDMALQANGQIVVVGSIINLDAVTVKHKTVYYGDWNIGLVRYLASPTTINGVSYPAGSLDPTFGNGGKVTTNISTYTGDTYGVNYQQDDAYGVAIQDDGKIVVGGRSFTSSGTTEGVLVRYLASPTTINGVSYPAGSLDPTFGQGGIIHINQPNFTGDGVWDVAILRDPTNPANDKIVTMETPYSNASGSTQRSVAVARYNLDGSLDTTFGTNGRTVTTVPGVDLGDWGMALQSDGSVVVTGYYHYTNGAPQDTFLLRYTPAGVLDSTFGNNGITVFDAGGSDIGYSVAIQPSDGKILVAGYSTNSLLTINYAYLARFLTNGQIDTTFGSNGEALNTFANSSSTFQGLAVQPSDGKIVAVGEADSPSGKTRTYNVLIARFQGDTTTQSAAASSMALVQTSPATTDAALTSLVTADDPQLSLLSADVLGTSRKRAHGSSLPA